MHLFCANIRHRIPTILLSGLLTFQPCTHQGPLIPLGGPSFQPQGAGGIWLGIFCRHDLFPSSGRMCCTDPRGTTSRLPKLDQAAANAPGGRGARGPAIGCTRSITTAIGRTPASTASSCALNDDGVPVLRGLQAAMDEGRTVQLRLLRLRSPVGEATLIAYRWSSDRADRRSRQQIDSLHKSPRISQETTSGYPGPGRYFVCGSPLPSVSSASSPTTIAPAWRHNGRAGRTPSGGRAAHHRQLDREPSRLRRRGARGQGRGRCTGWHAASTSARSATAARSSARCCTDGEERTIKNVVHYPPGTRACIAWAAQPAARRWSRRGGPGWTTTPAATCCRAGRCRRARQRARPQGAPGRTAARRRLRLRRRASSGRARCRASSSR